MTSIFFRDGKSDRYVPHGFWNMIVAFLLGVGLSLYHQGMPVFVYYAGGTIVLAIVGVLSLLVNVRVPVVLDLKVKGFLLGLVALSGGVTQRYAPYAPKEAVRLFLTLPLVLLGILVIDGAIREWGGGRDTSHN